MSLVESLPSKVVTVLEAPRTRSFNAEFQYLYWMSDENTNELGYNTLDTRTIGQSTPERSPTQILDQTFDGNITTLTRQIPRLVKLSWNRSVIDSQMSRPTGVSTTYIKDNISRLITEDSFTLSDYTAINYQDKNSDIQYMAFASELATILSESNGVGFTSSGEISNVLNASTTDAVTSGFISDIVSSFHKKHITFTNRTQSSVAMTLSERLANVAVDTKLNSKVFWNVLQVVQQDSIGALTSGISGDAFSAKAQAIQRSAASSGDSGNIYPEDYELSFPAGSYISWTATPPSGQGAVVSPLGYIIEKTFPDGSVHRLIIEDPLTVNVIDGQIKYGATYFYRIQPVYQLEIEATTSDTSGNGVVTLMVAGRFSPMQIVNTVDLTPPPPPSDFNISWDYTKNCPRCSWSLPTNSKQSIKYIQLFRRPTINDPFQLIQMWNFDNTNPPQVILQEVIDPHIVAPGNNFVGLYSDAEFVKTSSAIYAVVSIDAHGIFSNYSNQIEIKFGFFENKLLRKQISASGAPRCYPNAYLNNSEVFVDTLRDSGHSAITVIFNPDCLSVTDASGTDLGLLTTDLINNGKYRLQMTSVDLQAQQQVDISIIDQRRTLT